MTQRSERLRFDLAAARDRQEAASGKVETAPEAASMNPTPNSRLSPNNSGSWGRRRDQRPPRPTASRRRSPRPSKPSKPTRPPLSSCARDWPAWSPAPEEDTGPDRRMELQTAAEATRASGGGCPWRCARWRSGRPRSVEQPHWRPTPNPSDRVVERPGKTRETGPRPAGRRGGCQAITTVRAHVGRSVAAAQQRRDELQQAARERSEELSAVGSN